MFLEFFNFLYSNQGIQSIFHKIAKRYCQRSNLFERKLNLGYDLTKNNENMITIMINFKLIRGNCIFIELLFYLLNNFLPYFSNSFFYKKLFDFYIFQ